MFGWFQKKSPPSSGPDITAVFELAGWCAAEALLNLSLASRSASPFRMNTRTAIVHSPSAARQLSLMMDSILIPPTSAPLSFADEKVIRKRQQSGLRTFVLQAARAGELWRSAVE
jgi:shikimate 5-dehydrogenase